MQYETLKSLLCDLNGIVKDNENLKQNSKKQNLEIVSLKKELLELKKLTEEQKKQIDDLKEKNKVMQAKMGGHCKAKENLKKQLEQIKPAETKPPETKKTETKKTEPKKTEPKLPESKSPKEETVYNYVMDTLKFYDKPVNLKEIYDIIIVRKPEWKFKANAKEEGLDLKKQIGSVLLSYTNKNVLVRTGSFGKYNYHIKK